MKKVNVLNQSRPQQTALSAIYCETFFCKLKGLTFRSKLPDNQGLLLVENIDNRISTAIHMLFVFYKLAIIWINSDGVVVDCRIAYPWVSFLFPRKAARYVLEISPENLSDYQVGDKVHFEEIN